MNKYKLFLKLFICFCLLCLVLLFLFFEKINLKFGKIYYNRHDFQKAAACYNLALRYDKVLFKTKILKREFFEKKEKSLYLKIGDCYTESGNIPKVISFYDDILSQYTTKNIENEDFLNYLELERAINYSKLGYFDKALQTYTKLQDWYPQLLIKTYINMKNYEKAEEILFSNQIQEVIKNGDDIDSATLNYLLMQYYKEKGLYQKIEEFAQKKDLDVENKLISKIILADLYETLGKNEQAYKIYEELLLLPKLKNSTDFNLLIHYAVLTAKNRKLQEAKELFQQIDKSQKNLYKYSPQKICLQYYGTKIFTYKKGIMKKQSNKLLKKLNLKQDSYFYDNVEDFCKFNTQVFN